MQGYAAKTATYQYPDPDDLDDGTRFAWAGDDNDYIPVALRQTPSSNLQASEAEKNDHTHSPLCDIHHHEQEVSRNQESGATVEADLGIAERDGSGVEFVFDGRLGDPYIPAMEDPLAASGAPSKGQKRARHVSASRGRNTRRGGLGRGNPGIKRGLRNPLEPEPEFKVLHSQATMAFIVNNYDEAETLILQALQINPEMYPAHSLLSQIHAARGDLDKAIAVAYNGAHTQPRDTEMWSRIARMLLDHDHRRTTTTLKEAVYCYNRIISIDKYNVEARFQRAALNHELGKFKQVVSEYELLNKYFPHDTTVLRHLAQASIEVNEPYRALRLYNVAIAHFQDSEPAAPTSFSWSDVNVLVELYLLCREFDKGLELTKSLSRWLLGRQNDHCWENFTEDDREWDLNDCPRRVHFPDFIPSQYEANSYGAGLPLDLRIKLGIFRLNLDNQHVDEAINHFEWLDPADGEIGAKIFDYPDLFRDVARSLMEKGLYQDAIRFYEPLQQVLDYVDDSYRSELARCYAVVGRIAEAEAIQPSILDFDEDDDEEDYGENDSISSENDTREEIVQTPAPVPKRAKKSVETQKIDVDYLKELFNQRQSLKGLYQKNQSHLKAQWKSVNQRLVQFFLQEKGVFPGLKHLQSMDYTQQARHLFKRKARENNCAINSRSEIGAYSNAAINPDGFAGISFEDWLEIFLEYGIYLAHEGKSVQAYQIIASATQANVLNGLPDSLFLIHVCWFTCALLNNDDETLCSVSRWFMKDCQFVPDAYRLFSALNRLCDSDRGWFNCGPSQKHILRQVKAMDFSLAGDARGRNNHQERSAYTAKDAKGNLVLPQNMDVSLLMLYGHVLYAGKSYVYANNYFLRALSVDPENSIIKLSLALGYVHHALKRQAENRHQLLMQGFAFLFEYYHRRQDEGGVSEKQEAAYNVARAFHMLGLTHLAIPYYEHCLALSNSVQKMCCELVVEDFALEAAFALQGIWATNGNEERALKITQQWLQM